jgi:membrane protease YdiL (CAAX protease family)
MTRDRHLNILLIIISIIVCISFFVGLPYLTTKSYALGTIILSVCLLTMVGLIWYLGQEEKKDLKKELKKEFIYIFHDSTVAWIIGLWVGSVISGFVLLFFGVFDYTHAEVNPSAFDIVSIYVGSVLGVLAIRAFYKSLHPIYDELELIKQITSDLNNAKNNASIWFSFPALNLCQFRVVTHLVKHGGKEFKEYTTALNTKITQEHSEFHGICYNKDNINKLFDKYGEINNDSLITNLADAIIACKNVAGGFVDSIKGAESNNLKSKFYEMIPENPVESFIIIGDVVYTIQAWGLPVYKVTEINGTKVGKFENPFKGATTSKLVKLIAYRQHDGELARTIIERTKTIINI